MREGILAAAQTVVDGEPFGPGQALILANAVLEAAVKIEDLKTLISDLADHISTVTPDASAWVDEGGLADRVDKALT